MLERMPLSDGAFLDYDSAFFDAIEADELFASLTDTVPWVQERGGFRPFPRLTAFVADAGVDYRYSGVTHHGEGWPAELAAIKARIEAASAATFNSLLLNRYRDGQDSIGFHADDEPELGPDPIVASISLGAVREFVLKHRTTKETRKLQLAPGSLLVMGGTCQRFWLHGVPKTTQPVGERINLTFRYIYL